MKVKYILPETELTLKNNVDIEDKISGQKDNRIVFKKGTKLKVKKIQLVEPAGSEHNLIGFTVENKQYIKDKITGIKEKTEKTLKSKISQWQELLDEMNANDCDVIYYKTLKSGKEKKKYVKMEDPKFKTRVPNGFTYFSRHRKELEELIKKDRAQINENKLGLVDDKITDFVKSSVVYIPLVEVEKFEFEDKK